jgi:CheY-like chemotaxis protein
VELSNHLKSADLHTTSTQHQAEDALRASALLSSAKAIAMTPDGPQLKILLVEDNLVNQKVLLMQLSSLGYQVDVAANGQEAMDLLTVGPYDLILMDCQMPVKDGYQATEQIKNSPASAFVRGRHPIIVAITANAMQDDRQKCLDAGMDDYLSKPVPKEQLSALIEHWTQTIFTSQQIMELEPESQIAPSEKDLIGFDWEHLHQLSENNREFELELLQMFAEDAAIHLQAIELAIAQPDFSTLEREAHQIKGSSANVGAKPMQVAAAKLEQMSVQKQLAGATDLLAELEQYCDRLQSFLSNRA